LDKILPPIIRGIVNVEDVMIGGEGVVEVDKTKLGTKVSLWSQSRRCLTIAGIERTSEKCL
jgi:hypothetical protein